ncbi:cobalamin B12-binding domain-containing protein [Streptomyces sp. NPDC048737]|uniref:cobalamin B12-binding domain-containing protein n=1 Tax=unclassified Streptomyces TaxID=2593676 RepID=UPI003425EC5D
MTDARTTDREVAPLRERLWAAAVDADEAGAVAVLRGAAQDGRPEEALLLDVVAAVQRRVGEEWTANRITVAAEHAATAVTDGAVAALAHDLPRPTGHRPRVTVACVDGERHALPARPVAETLRRRGRRVDFPGAHVPTPHLVAHLHATAPDAVLLSASLPTRLPTAHAALTACQSTGVPLLVGGAASGPDGREARAVRADGWAAHARHAADLLEAGGEKPYAPAARHQVDDLPHLADQEHTLITRTRAALVRQVLHDPWERSPVLRSSTPQQQDRTAEDIRHIIEFLATALYFDDPDIFARFVGRTTGVLTARGVPVESLHLGLTVLAGHLYDFPRARRFLNETAPDLDSFATTLSVTGTGTPA